MNSKIKSAVYGALIGDAFAMPYEYKTAKALHELPSIDMVPPSGNVKSHHAKAGTYSDEGSMMLAMMDSLTQMHHFKPGDYLQRLSHYFYQGDYCYKNEAFGYSLHFSKAIEQYNQDKVIYRLYKKDGYQDCGCLVSVLPLMLMDLENDAKSTIELCHKCALITYGDVRYGICMAIYGQWVKNVMHSIKDPFIQGIKDLSKYYNKEIKQLILDEFLTHNVQSTAPMAIDTLMQAFNVINHTSSFKGAVLEATLKGGQTTALTSVVGSIAGILYGYQSIPSLWIDLLRNKEAIDIYLEKFIEEVRGE